MEKIVSPAENQHLTGEELVALMQEEKGKLCISIIVPTHKLSPDRRVDRLQLEKAVFQVKKYLQHTYREEETDLLQESLDELYGQIDFNHNAQGIGLFVSPLIKQRVQFFFPVKEKVVISRSFEIRDLLYQVNYANRYFTLVISEKDARLFEGRLESLREIKDSHFPQKYTDDYIYSRPSRGSSFLGNATVKEFEKDKSQLKQIRYRHFARQVADELNQYLINDTPVILAGDIKDLADFTSAAFRHLRIIGELHGNYDHMTESQLAELSWPIIKTNLDQADMQTIRDFEEKYGEGLAITGIREIWKAVKEGRGLHLLVEKDFAMPGFLYKDDPYHLHLKPLRGPHRILTDAVDELIELVLEKNGRVSILENDSLKNYQRMALITRY